MKIDAKLTLFVSILQLQLNWNNSLPLLIFHLEGTFSEYLGIQYTKHDDGSILMNQPGLIQKIMDTTQLINCNPNQTPNTKEVLPMDPDDNYTKGSWNYCFIVEILLYLSTNIMPIYSTSCKPSGHIQPLSKTIICYCSQDNNPILCWNKGRRNCLQTSKEVVP